MEKETADSGWNHAFDWLGMHDRISDARAALSDMGEMAPEVLEELWARRAAKLAQVPPEDDGGERVDLVLIRLGREVYGLGAKYVWDIKPLGQITPVPRVPDWVAGVVNRRGRIYSVVNLQRFFNLPAVEGDRGKTQVPQLVVVETSEMELALLADDVLSIEAIPTAWIEDAAGTVRGLPPEYVRGVARYEVQGAPELEAGKSSLVVVLDLPTLLADERLVVHEEVL
jgi:chemotaxis signal transduction protein